MKEKIRISYFKAPVTRTKPYKSIPLSDVYMVLNGHWYKYRTETLRKIEDKKQNRRFKAENFPFVTFSGTFKRRNEKGLIQHSSLMVLDFDHLDNIDKLKLRLLKDKYFETQILFTSPNGNGLKWVVPIHLNGKFSHGEYFDAISNYIKATYKIEVDKSGRDVTRVCFLCFDPEAFIHPDHGKMDRLFPAEIYLVKRKKFQPERWLNKPVLKKQSSKVSSYKNMTKKQYEIEVILRRIETNQLDLTCEYEDWLKLGFAFSNEFGEAGRDYFHRVCRFYPGYDMAECDGQFDQCLKGKRTGGTTIKSFFAAAYDAGINVKV